MKIGILGGTFDPVHNGHLALARAAFEQFQLDKVLFVPALNPPHKMERHDFAPAADRYRMVELALKNEPHFELSDLEFKRAGTSYTVDTLREFEKQYPKAKPYLILGADSLEKFSTWKEPEEIKKRAHLVVANRPDFTVKKSEGVTLLSMQDVPVSSTEIRSRLAKGERLGNAFLPSAVEDYILKRQLYRDDSTCTSS